MCGIAGHVGPSLDDRARRALFDAIARRGPDDHGQWSEAPAWLAHRRLSIIGVDACGRNPMFNEDGSVVLVFNGELFNYRELRRELVAKGHRFSSQTDTECILHLYEEHGAALCDRLEGMFAFALWDRTRGRLLAARDPFGEKPFYYVAPEGGRALTWSSSVVGLVRAGVVPRELDPAALEAYLLFGACVGDTLPVRGVHALPAGHLLEFDPTRGSLSVRRFRTVETEAAAVAARGASGDASGAAALTWDDVVGAVSRRMIADVPVGVFLSGGVDSTTVAAAMRQVVPGRLMSFSIGYERAHASFDETDDARRSAELLGTEHEKEIITADGFADAMDDIARATDLPSHDGVNTYFASRLAGRHVKVAMTGIGGDELFGGYSTFRYEREARRRTGMLLRTAARLGAPAVRALASRAEADGRTAWPLLLLEQGSGDRDDATYRWFQVRRLMRPSAVSALLPGHAMQIGTRQWRTARARLLDRLGIATESGDDLQRLESAGYLSPVLIRDSDAMSMHHALELRVPFLDRDIVRHALAYDLSTLIGTTGGKAPLRHAVAGHVPPHCLSNAKKGFGVPLGAWLRTPRVRREVEARFHEPPALAGGVLDGDALRTLARRFYDDAGATNGQQYRLFARVWLTYSLLRWLETLEGR